MAKKGRQSAIVVARRDPYGSILAEVVELLESARRASARAVNAVLTAAYWQVGRRIVEGEQDGQQKARYGRQLLERLSGDLTARYGRGFSYVNLTQMRRFYLLWPTGKFTCSGRRARFFRRRLKNPKLELHRGNRS
jgi:hypothetical protein